MYAVYCQHRLIDPWRSKKRVLIHVQMLMESIDLGCLLRSTMRVRSEDLLCPDCVSFCFGYSSNRWAFHTIGTVKFLQQSQTIINGHNGSFFSFISEVWHIRSKQSLSSSQLKIVHLCIEKFFKRPLCCKFRLKYPSIGAPFLVLFWPMRKWWMVLVSVAATRL